MQETAFIWDLDGTLLDSYEAILSGIEETYALFSIPFDKEKVRAFILKYSVQDLLVQVAEERGLDVCFTEILTSQSGFARKPSPEAATYLISKYHLKPDRTFYIGDRTLDIEFAQSSSIQSINFLGTPVDCNHQISCLADIPSLSL